jgi:hypothetical protein
MCADLAGNGVLKLLCFNSANEGFGAFNVGFEQENRDRALAIPTQNVSLSSHRLHPAGKLPSALAWLSFRCIGRNNRQEREATRAKPSSILTLYGVGEQRAGKVS